jgi:hypothetical protein
LEAYLGHRLPLPDEVKASPDSHPDISRLTESLKFWLDLMDMAITPPMLREALKRSSGPETAHALLRYLVAKASTRASDRDKTDCVITYLFRTPNPDSPNQWQRPETDSSYYHLSQAALAFEGELYRALGEVQVESMSPAHVQLLHEFEYFHQELEEFRHFDQIMDSTIVQRVRELKQSLGKSFYHPDSLANMATWNDVFGRRFDDLFHDATKQIKTFAENVKREGGSIMSRVEGDITVKQLAEIQTQEILAEDYQNSQEQFRKVSQFKKAVDHKKAARPGYAPGPARPIPPQAPPIPGRPSGDMPAVQPLSAPITAPALTQPQAKSDAEVLAVPPSPAVQNAVQEGKLHSTKESIKEHVRTADANLVHIVPVKRNKVMLTPAEVEAFRADHGGEKSFRADYANILMVLVSYHARMLLEVDEYNQKSASAYLWKPHADALGYLLSTLERIYMEAEQIKVIAQQRGLQDKATAVDLTIEKVKRYALTVSQTLQAADQSLS